ncbi:MAG: hypothetical protein FJ107_04710 [Deltaproteobacteria bacterium]|nr:hypothetical protein [Deltaproteobacteria bacterium]MBM4347416.1 hypothetical protein [Deltaproteobacteria bacterium]
MEPNSTSPELSDLMSKSFFDLNVYGDFPVDSKGAKSGIISLMKRSAVKLHLIPGTLKTRAYLKRIFMGKLVPLPHEITEGMAPYEPPVEIPTDEVNRDFKILYAVGKK